MSIKGRLNWCFCLVVLIAGAALMWRFDRARQPHIHSYAPTTPRIGDCALIDLYVGRPRKQIVSGNGKPDSLHESRRRVARLLIECVGVAGKTCQFRVLYASEGKPSKPAYSVFLDYGTDDLRKRVVVKDMNGSVVAPAHPIDGNPVPFHYILSFNERYLGRLGNKQVTLENGNCGRLLRHGYDDSRQAWSAVLNVWEGVHSRWSMYAQQWRSGEWIWSREECAGSRGDWCAIRQSITEVENFRTQE